MSALEAARQLRYLLSPLDKWRFDPKTEELCINKPGEVFVRQNGRFERHDVDIDFECAFDIAVLAGALNQQNVSETNPLLAADLPDGERLQAVLPPCVPQGTVSLTLRVPGSKVAPLETMTSRYRLDKWNRWDQREKTQRENYKTLLYAYDSGDIIRFFREVVRLKVGLIMCGSTGSGKTTALKTIVSIMEAYERIITIENALEVDIINQPNHVRLLYSHGEQSMSNVTQKQLLEAYLRMRPDRGCVGELRDPEAAFTFLSECLTGHPGSPSSIHGKNAPQAANRLFNLFKASDGGKSFSDEMIISQLGIKIALKNVEKFR